MAIYKNIINNNKTFTVTESTLLFNLANIEQKPTSDYEIIPLIIQMYTLNSVKTTIQLPVYNYISSTELNLIKGNVADIDKYDDDTKNYGTSLIFTIFQKKFSKFKLEHQGFNILMSNINNILLDYTNIGDIFNKYDIPNTSENILKYNNFLKKIKYEPDDKSINDELLGLVTEYNKIINIKAKYLKYKQKYLLLLKKNNN